VKRPQVRPILTLEGPLDVPAWLALPEAASTCSKTATHFELTNIKHKHETLRLRTSHLETPLTPSPRWRSSYCVVSCTVLRKSPTAGSTRCQEASTSKKNVIASSTRKMRSVAARAANVTNRDAAVTATSTRIDAHATTRTHIPESDQAARLRDAGGTNEAVAHMMEAMTTSPENPSRSAGVLDAGLKATTIATATMTAFHGPMAQDKAMRRTADPKTSHPLATTGHRSTLIRTSTLLTNVTRPLQPPRVPAPQQQWLIRLQDTPQLHRLQ
jgi:hypothetical protein